MTNDDIHAVPGYFRYWGKAMPIEQKGDKAVAPCHLLPYHCLDVAAVGYWLMAPEAPRTMAIASSLGIKPKQLQSVFAFVLALHDVGKFARAFQGLATPPVEILVPPDSRLPYESRHDATGMLFWKQSVLGRLNDQGIQRWGWPQGVEFNRHARRSLEVLLAVAFGHHGKPVDGENASLEKQCLPEDEEANWEFGLAVAELMAPQWPVEAMNDKGWGKKLKRLSWHLAGQAVLADWLGSDQREFLYQSEHESLQSYWVTKALPRAKNLLERVGLNKSPAIKSFPGIKPFFGFEPTPLQHWSETVEMPEEPQLFILEDVTGAGKTEAALVLAHRLMEKGQANGVYFGLPTMATSNAMYGRIAEVYRRWYESGNPNLVLAHGARHLNESFAESVIPDQGVDQGYGPDESTASASCNQWFADSRKKALLADVGVGTIDQALMALLPFRHQALRLVGMANKVLVVDEIHACDDYMLTLLSAVLEAHVQQGGSAILLTATLPLKRRHQLVKSWLKGMGYLAENLLPLEANAFPLATQVRSDGIVEESLETRASVARKVGVTLLNAESEAMDALVKAAERGECACWVRNTVDDAISAYEQIRERVSDPEKVLLFHSRFVMADRQRIEEAALQCFGKSSNAKGRAGRILIGTQVVEQSLDLDFDTMVSDLAPVDLLIQRAGRLHRHLRSRDGDRLSDRAATDERPTPYLQVFAPSLASEIDKDWIKRFLPGTAAVYRNHAQLWLTLNVLLEEGAIQMPERARALIESVYGLEAETKIPEGLMKSHWDQEGKRQSEIAMGQFNLLNLEKGYSVSSALNGWQEEVEIGTRLSDEPSLTVTLVKLDETGERLLPWVEEGRHAWELSQIRLRQSLAEQLPDWPEALEEKLKPILDRKPGLRFSRFWLWNGVESKFAYDSGIGLYRSRSE